MVYMAQYHTLLFAQTLCCISGSDQYTYQIQYYVHHGGTSLQSPHFTSFTLQCKCTLYIVSQNQRKALTMEFNYIIMLQLVNLPYCTNFTHDSTVFVIHFFNTFHVTYLHTTIILQYSFFRYQPHFHTFIHFFPSCKQHHPFLILLVESGLKDFKIYFTDVREAVITIPYHVRLQNIQNAEILKVY